jgi:hypothetical protein
VNVLHKRLPKPFLQSFCIDPCLCRIFFWADLLGTLLIIIWNGIAFRKYTHRTLFNFTSFEEFILTWQPVMFIMLAVLQLLFLNAAQQSYQHYRTQITMFNRSLRVVIVGISLSNLDPIRLNKIMRDVFDKSSLMNDSFALLKFQAW